MTAAEIKTCLPAQFTHPIAISGDRNTIQGTDSIANNVSQLKGFPSIFSTPRSESGKSVARKDMNALFNMVSSLNYYFQYMGRNPWISKDTYGGYPKGACVWYSDAEWVSTADSNKTVPGASGASWTKLSTASGLVLDNNAVKAIITKDYIETKLGYKIVITSTSPSTYAANTLYFITGT